MTSPRTLPAVHQYALTYAYAHRVHACARHRQVLSNRRVLSIINVYRMRNRVQARPRYHPPYPPALHPPFWPPLLAGSVHPLSPPRPFSAPRSHFARSKSAFMKIRPRADVVSESQTRLSFGLPLITSPAFFSLPSFFRARNGAPTCAAVGAAGWKCSPERTNEGADGVFLIFLLARAVLSFVTKLRTKKGGTKSGR